MRLKLDWSYRDVMSLRGKAVLCVKFFFSQCKLHAWLSSPLSCWLNLSTRLGQRFPPPLCLQWPVSWRDVPTSMDPRRTLLYLGSSSWLCRKGSSSVGMTSNPVRLRSSRCWWTFWSAPGLRSGKNQFTIKEMKNHYMEKNQEADIGKGT